MSQQLAPGGTRSDSGERQKQKRKPVRRDAEKRRQQNIQAQRRYREKLRERMENLEALAAATQQSTPPITTEDAMRSDSILLHDASSLSVAASSTAHSSDYDSFLSSFDPSTSQMNMTHPNFAWDPSLWDYDFSETLSHSDISPSSLGVGDQESQHSLTTQNAPFAPLHKDTNQAMCRKSTTINCACDQAHLQITAHELGSSCRVEVTMLDLASVRPKAAVVPDPYANHIRLDSICTLAAMVTLRTQIGLTDDMMCSLDIPSPFYRPIRASGPDNPDQTVVHAVQRMFRALQPDLRPNAEQITVEHPPFIDALPFRSLRRNLVLRRDEIDTEEFLCDLVTGLVCWGGSGLGRRDRNASTGNASNGTPWDNRSWEAKIWFLKKYWSILGGEEGELVRQSEWWRGIRGEETSLQFETLAQ
ncbi:hypothetical protein CC79DRAFT_1371804 [Sarocladium strictum]